MKEWMLNWTWPWTPDDVSVVAETRVGLMNIPKRSAFVDLIVECYQNARWTQRKIYIKITNRFL
jgi:hypothetical protein